MKKLTVKELKEIRGGVNLTSTTIKYLAELVEILIYAGKKLGGSIRRIGKDQLCPLE